MNHDNDSPHDDARLSGNRRKLLKAGAGALALGAVPGASQFAARAQAPAGGFDWKRFKGEKIEVFHVKSPRGDLLTRNHKEFEDLTGISVGSDAMPEQQQRQRYNKELFDAKNVAYPKNFAEIIGAAAKLHDPSKGIAGFVARGLKNANLPVWSSFFLGNGGRFVDGNGRLMTETRAFSITCCR